MTEELTRQMNDLYRRLEYRCMFVYNALHHRVFSLESEYRTRHSCFDEQGNRVSDDYPLPYVEVAGYCEFQIEPDCLSCFTKLNKKGCVVLGGAEFKGYAFDAWGEDDCYKLLFRSQSDGGRAADVLSGSDEDSFIIHFRLPSDADETEIYTFAKLLRKRGFYI